VFRDERAEPGIRGQGLRREGIRLKQSSRR